MKYILIVVFAGTLYSCQSKFEIFPFGTASAKLNNALWVADDIRVSPNASCYKGRLGINLTKHNSNAVSQTFFFHNVTAKVGTYKVYPANSSDPCKDTLIYSSYDTTIGGDVAKDYYIALSSTDNRLQITDVNINKGRIEGTFDVTYIVFTKQDALSPDTIRVTNGQFRAKIHK